MFCNVPGEGRDRCRTDVEHSIYELPLALQKEGMDQTRDRPLRHRRIRRAKNIWDDIVQPHYSTRSTR